MERTFKKLSSRICQVYFMRQHNPEIENFLFQDQEKICDANVLFKRNSTRKQREHKKIHKDIKRKIEYNIFR